MAIYIGNLSYTIKENEVSDVFSEFGTVTSVKIIKDRKTGRSKGYGFVDMDSEASEDAAVNAINGREVKGRNMVVNKARPMENKQ